MGIISEEDLIEKIKSFDEYAFKAGERADVAVLDSHDFRYLKSGQFKANLHVHTQYSDGEMSIAELLGFADDIAKNTPDFITAITDHDTIDGDKEAVKLINNYKHANICLGVEMSTVAINFSNQPKPLQVHLLVYGINPEDKKLDEYLRIKREQKLALTKATIEKLDKALPEYHFNIEEGARCHPMILKGEDEVAHPMKKYTSGKILLGYYFPNADFSYEEPIYKFKYMFKGSEPYHKIYKKVLEMYTGEELPKIPDKVEEKIQLARNIYLQSHPSVGKMLEPFSSFEDAVKFVASLDSGVMSIAHPARTKAYCPEFYEYLFEHFKHAGGDKAMFYEGYYQSYEGSYFQEWSEKIDKSAEKFGLLKTGGLDSHGKSLVVRCPRKDEI